jgi:hypothetical protein
MSVNNPSLSRRIFNLRPSVNSSLKWRRSKVVEMIVAHGEIACESINQYVMTLTYSIYQSTGANK